MNVISHHAPKPRCFTRAKALAAFLCAMSFFCALAVPELVHAAEKYEITPSVSARGTWNDNFFMKEVEDYELQINPKLSAAYTSERSQASVTGDLINFHYADITDYNRTTYNVGGNVGHMLTERLKISANGSWRRDYSLDTYWDDNFEEHSMLGRSLLSASPTISYEVSERDSVSLSFSWAAMDYAENISSYADYNMLQGSLTWQRLMLDGRFALIGQTSWQHIEFDNPLGEYPNYTPFDGTYSYKQDITQNVYSGLVGIYWAPAQTLTVQAMAGASYTESETKREEALRGSLGGIFDFERSATQRDYYTGFTGSFDLNWRDDNMNTRLNAEQTYTPAAAGELRRVTQFALHHTYNMTRNAFINATGRYVISRSDRTANNDVSWNYWNVSVRPGYRITEDTTVSAQYSYVHQDNKVTNITRHSNSIFLQLTYSLPIGF